MIKRWSLNITDTFTQSHQFLKINKLETASTKQVLNFKMLSHCIINSAYSKGIKW